MLKAALEPIVKMNQGSVQSLPWHHFDNIESKYYLAEEKFLETQQNFIARSLEPEKLPGFFSK